MILITVTMILIIVTTIPAIPTTISNILCTFHYIFHYIPPPKYWKFSKCTHFGERRTTHHFGNTHKYYIKTHFLCNINIERIIETFYHGILENVTLMLILLFRIIIINFNKQTIYFLHKFSYKIGLKKSERN